jgi:hypothetical protein
MPDLEPRLTRGQWRVWLKWVVQSNVLERLPPVYDAETADHGRNTEEVGRRMLSRLDNSERGREALLELQRDLPRFRHWVESRLKQSRKIILSERESGRVDRAWLERESAAMSLIPERRASRPAAPPRVPPRWDPMWDEALDG